MEWEESADLMEVASKCDVVYQTRIQKERFGEKIDLYEEARGKYIVNKDVLRVMQKHAVVMHPLPRLDEVKHLGIHMALYHVLLLSTQAFEGVIMWLSIKVGSEGTRGCGFNFLH